MLWKDVEKHPPLFRIGRLQKQFYLLSELAREMSSDTSEIQTDSGKVYRVFRQIIRAIVYDFFENFGKIRQLRRLFSIYNGCLRALQRN